MPRIEIPVFSNERLVGVCAADGSFRYASSWLDFVHAFPVSTTLPLRKEAYAPGEFGLWAEHLLPEGRRRKVLAARLSMREGDVLGMLSETGLDTVGALSFGKPADPRSFEVREIGGEDELALVLDRLPTDPFSLGIDYAPVAGAQFKIAVVVESGRIGLPLGGTPSTHILKPNSEHIYGSVQNEAFCLTLAHRIGLSAARVATGCAGKRTYLLVDRFDRAADAAAVRRLHQEDFCQALGRPSSVKYQFNGGDGRGPTLQDLFAVAAAHMPPGEALGLFRQVVFNTICGNTDAHAKNYSLSITPHGIGITPIYDVLCADVYDNISRNMAQKIAGKARGDYLRGRHWQRQARACGISEQEALRTVEELAEAILSTADRAMQEVVAMPAGGHPLLERMRASICRRATNLRRQLSELEPVEDPAPPAP